MSDIDGVVVRGSKQVVVPSNPRDRYLQLGHDSHDSVVKTKELLRSLAWWLVMDRDVEEVIRNCEECQVSDKVLTQRTAMAPFQPVSLPMPCLEKLCIDIVSPMREHLTVTDLRSQWLTTDQNGSRWA